ncbi:MAG: hypothetical protein AAGL49_15180, partial [Pseudomonadota bacterium]
MGANSPIFAAVGEALTFGARRIGLNVRLGWLPLALMAVWFFGALAAAPFILPGVKVFEAIIGAPAPDPERFLRLFYAVTIDDIQTFFIFDDWTAIALIVLLTPMMTLFWSSYATPILRLVALGEEPGRAPFR